MVTVCPKDLNMDPNQLDSSRQADYYNMQRKLADPNTSDFEKKRANDILYAIKLQQRSPAILKLREQMKTAVINGDKDKIEKLGELAQKIDKDWMFT